MGQKFVKILGKSMEKKLGGLKNEKEKKRPMKKRRKVEKLGETKEEER